jgi:hypothetical protein
MGQCPTRQQPSRDVVEPQALAEFVKLLRRLHNTPLTRGAKKTSLCTGDPRLRQGFGSRTALFVW